jgi:hypothetical protein
MLGKAEVSVKYLSQPQTAHHTSRLDRRVLEFGSPPREANSYLLQPQHLMFPE